MKPSLRAWLNLESFERFGCAEFSAFTNYRFASSRSVALNQALAEQVRLYSP